MRLEDHKLRLRCDVVLVLLAGFLAMLSMGRIHQACKTSIKFFLQRISIDYCASQCGNPAYLPLCSTT